MIQGKAQADFAKWELNETWFVKYIQCGKPSHAIFKGDSKILCNR